jgi:glycosyltransferase involved in cell wall biosynthesis
MRVLAIHDRPGWSMDHHCQDLKRALLGRCDFDVVSCGKRWEEFSAGIALARSYDRIYVAGELLGQFVFKALDESVRQRVLTGVHSYFLWDHGYSVGGEKATGIVNPEFVAALRSMRAAAVICEGLVQAFPGVRTHLAHYGVDTRIFHPAPGNRIERPALRVGWVGVDLPHKNYRLFLKIRERLAGVMDFMEVLLKPETYFAASNAVLTRADMNDFYNQIDVLIVTADSEGAPLPPLEASACGVPVITPRIGCMPEFVRHGVDGFLVDSYEPCEFVGHLRDLGNDRELLRRMRMAAMAKAFGPWSLDAKAGAWFDFFSMSSDPKIRI